MPIQSQRRAREGPIARPVVLVALTCALVTLAENFDLAVMSLAAPRMIPDFGISRGDFGLAIGAGMLGYFVGAPLGGVLGDRYGYRRVILVGLAGLSMACLGTPLSRGLGALLAARFLTGFFVALPFPNTLAIATFTLGEARKSRAVALTTIGGAAGGIAAGALAAWGGASLPWRSLFFAAAAGTILLAPLALVGLPPMKRSDPGPRLPRPHVGRLLFGGRRVWATLALWAGNLFTTYGLHVVMNWLPTMVVERGLGASQAGIATTLLNLGAIVGGFVFSGLLDRGRRRLIFLGIYAGIVAALGYLAVASGVPAVLSAAAILGLFLVGGQMALYSVPSMIYPEWGRAAGTGWAIGIGRWGAIAGPWLAGTAFDKGHGGPAILLSVMPVIVLAGASVIAALSWRPAADNSSAAVVDLRLRA